MVGQIAFVGLMVPHIVRFLVGTDYAKVLPLTALTGGLLMILADTVARMLGEAPVGAIISFIGVPYFLYLVKRGAHNMIHPKLRRKQIVTLVIFSILLLAACTWSVSSGEYKIPVDHF